MKRLLLLASLWLAALPTVQAQDTVPKTIAYMGYLTDSSGDVVDDGDHTITFRLYEQAAGGVVVWEASRTVTTGDGLFSVVLGETVSLVEVSFDRPYYLGISIGAGDELAPRIPLVASAYSLHAKSVEAGAVGTEQLADDSVTGAKVADAAVGTAQLADGSVTTDKVADAAITSAELAADAVTAVKIASGAVVTSVNNVTDGVTVTGGDNVSVATNGSIVTITATGSELADDSVTSAKIAADAVTAAQIAADAVGSSELADDAVSTATIQDAAVTAAKVAAGTAVLSLNEVTDAITLVEGANIEIIEVGQNITIGTTGGNEVGTGDIADNSITSAKIIDSAIAEADLATDAVTSAKIVDGTIVAADIAGGAVVSSVNTLTDAVTLAAGTNIAINPVGNTLTIDATAGGDITGVTAGTGLTGGGTTGDVTVDIDAGGVGTTELAADAVTSGKIADATIVAADIATGAVATDEILDATIATADLANDAVTSAKIAASTIMAADIAAGAVVKTVNGLTDAVVLDAGTNITITPAGNTLTIDAGSGMENTLDEAYNEGGAGAGRIITADNGAVDIQGTDGLTVSGNVGIGQTSPTGRLEVKGTGNTSGTYAFNASNSDGNTILHMRDDQRVAIGYTAPLNRFSLLASADNTMDFALIKHDASAQIVRIGEQSGDGVIGIYDSGLNSFNHWLEGNDGSHSSLAVLTSSRLGIGVASPASKLEVGGGAVLFDGTAGTTPTSGAGTRLMWIPAKAAFRAGAVTGTQWDDASIGLNTTVAGGKDNVASSSYATVGGGQDNLAQTNTHATVGGGFNNNASGQYGIVAGGRNNTASGSDAVVVGGSSNTASADLSVVGGGATNTASGIKATVGGGQTNTVTDDYSVVGGGQNNQAGNNAGTTADRQHATVAGGVSNTASGVESTVSGGTTNVASGPQSTVGGGDSNTSSSTYTTVAGGLTNTAVLTGATVGGGSLNDATNNWATVAGGNNNDASSQYSTISGGVNNIASGLYSTVPGGHTNSAAGQFSFAAGRRAKANHDGAFVWGDQTDGDFTSTAVDQFLIRAGGGVGIGTTSPQRNLEVVSDNESNGIRIRSQNTSGRPVLDFLHGAGAAGTGAVVNGSVLGIIDFGGHDGISLVSAAARIRALAATNWNASNHDVNLVFQTTQGTSNTEKMRITASGNVGIGTTNATHKLSFANVTGSKIDLFDDTTTPPNYGFGVEASELRIATANSTTFYSGGYGGTQRMVIDGSGNVGIGATPTARLHVQETANPAALFNRSSSDGVIISIRQDGTEEGTISVSGTTISYNAFTGSHYGWTDQSIETATLVTLTGDNRRLQNNPDSEIIYGVTPSAVPNDPKILGAYLSLQESTDPAGPDNPHLVMAVGNGEMWVVDDGQDVEIGDHLISSEVAGHAMRDTGEFPVSHIVAIAVEPVNWNVVEESVDGRKHRRISVLFERFAMNHAVQTAAESAELTLVKAELSELRSEKETLARSNDELRTQLDALTAVVQRLEESQLKMAAR